MIKSQSPGDIRWRNAAYPLQVLDIKIQGARYSSKEAMIGLLRDVIDQLEKAKCADRLRMTILVINTILFQIFKILYSIGLLQQLKLRKKLQLFTVSHQRGSTCQFCGVALFGSEQFTHMCPDRD